jgi:hypothetical protein
MGACASSEAPVADIPPAKPHQPRPHEQTGGHPVQQEPARVDATPAKAGVDAGPPEAAELLNGLAGGDPQPLGSGAVDNAIAVLKVRVTHVIIPPRTHALPTGVHARPCSHRTLLAALALHATRVHDTQRTRHQPANAPVRTAVAAHRRSRRWTPWRA